MSRHQPVIGLTVYGPQDDRGFNIPQEYVRGIVEAGGIPMLLPPVGAEFVARWLDRVDGLLLAGGGDIDPSHYGNRGHETIYNLDLERDQTEMALARLALERQIPTLAICRGMQVVNVALGGTLHPHVPDIFGQQVEHRAPPREPVEHAVRVAPDSRLAAIMGTHRVITSSWHHQSVDRLGTGLKPVAWADDGCIEAVELAGNDRFMAVQWHPEHSVDRDPTQQALFRELVRMAAATAAAPPPTAAD